MNACVRTAEVIAAIKRLLILAFIELGENAGTVILEVIWASSGVMWITCGCNGKVACATLATITTMLATLFTKNRSYFVLLTAKTPAPQ